MFFFYLCLLPHSSQGVFISDFLALSHTFNERHQVETVVVLFALKARSVFDEGQTTHIESREDTALTAEAFCSGDVSHSDLPQSR